MFTKEVYIARRKTLVEKMGQCAPEGKRGIALFVGNVEAAAQYKDNPYKFRQDSSWLYYFGIDEPRYAAIIDLFADDVEIGDIIWMGPQPSVASKAALVGIDKSASYGSLNVAVTKALATGRNIHFLPPSRYYNTMKLASLVGIPEEDVCKVAPIEENGGRHASEELVKAVISMRLVKEACEIEQLDHPDPARGDTPQPPPRQGDRAREAPCHRCRRRERHALRIRLHQDISHFR